MALGGRGVVSVASNILPRQMIQFTQAMSEGNWEFAGQGHLKLYDLFKVLFVESNLGPVKFTAELLEIMSN